MTDRTDRSDSIDAVDGSDGGADADDGSDDDAPFADRLAPDASERTGTDDAPSASEVAVADETAVRESGGTGDPGDPGEPRPRTDDPERSTDESAAAPDDRDRRSRDGPLSDLASAVDERTGGSGDGSDDAFDDLFEREDVAEIDSEQLWERLENDRSPTDLLEEEREIREIEKHTYCHQCEHFSAPPSVECTREGTEILELSSLETFRVADCPVVLEDEELERRY